MANLKRNEYKIKLDVVSEDFISLLNLYYEEGDKENSDEEYFPEDAWYDILRDLIKKLSNNFKDKTFNKALIYYVENTKELNK